LKSPIGREGEADVGRPLEVLVRDAERKEIHADVTMLSYRESAQPDCSQTVRN
jgi:hypothetical protein